VNSAEAEKALKNARARKIPWIDVVGALDVVERAPVPKSGRSWIRLCSETSGYSVNQLRRFQAAARFVDRAASEIRPREKLLELAVTPLEKIARICNVDPKRGFQLLDRALSEHVPRLVLEEALRSLSALGRTSAANVSPVSAGRLAAKAFRTKCLEAIEHKIEYKIDNKIVHVSLSDAIVPKSGLLYPNPDFLVVSAGIDGKQCAVAVDAFDLRGVEYSDIIKRYALPEIVKATFFNSLWIICAGPEADTLVDVLNKLGRNNIGLILLNAALSDRKVIPPIGPPAPDRTQLWIDEMSPWLRKAIERKGWCLPGSR
jgi:hypothetical protein